MVSTEFPNRDIPPPSPEVRFPKGHMLVPWPSWDHWNFVRDSLFSSSPDSVSAALNRISGWRSRGCLPIAIQITAAIVEIQQKDPFFRKDRVGGEAVHSDEMLSMLYSMAIIRLVNGFVEKVQGFNNHKQKHALGKEKQSISKLADALGVPRVLVDIRHESSHGDLPSLPLLRNAILKALDWLKSHYWDPQKRAIPNARKEVKCRLQQMVSHMKNKHVEKMNSSAGKGKNIKKPGPFTVCSRLSSQITGKLLSSKYNGPQKQVSKISKAIARLYSVCPEEVISSLLEFYMSETPNLSSNTELKGIDVPNPGVSELLCVSEIDLKAIIIRLSRLKPQLLLGLLKEVLGRIEAIDALESDQSESCTKSLSLTSDEQIEHLSSLVPWLLVGMGELEDSGLIEIITSTQVSSARMYVIPKVTLNELLRRCLLLASSNKHLAGSALFLAQMMPNKIIAEKLKSLLQIQRSSQEVCTKGECNQSHGTDQMLDEHSLNEAKLSLNALKLHLKERASKHLHLQKGNDEPKKKWTLAKSWNPCPIGMLPCSFSSAAFLPVLYKHHDSSHNEQEAVAYNVDSMNSTLRKRDGSQRPALLESPNVQKRQREMPKDSVADLSNSLIAHPMKGMMLINGVWRKVGEEELQVIQDNVKVW